MQDRFKFRVWNKEQNRFHLNTNCDITASGTLVISQGIEGKKYIVDDDNYVVQQCTGLKDKNGKLIYEGDILGGIYENLYIHWCNKCKQFQLKAQDYGCMACEGDIHWAEVVEDNNTLEVIGNIYENPELIGGSKMEK